MKELAVCFTTLNPPVPFGSEGFDRVKTDHYPGGGGCGQSSGTDERAGRYSDGRGKCQGPAGSRKTSREFWELLQEMREEE